MGPLSLKKKSEVVCFSCEDDRCVSLNVHLFRYGVNPDVHNKAGKTALSIAGEEGKLSMVKCLAAQAGSQLLGHVSKHVPPNVDILD